MSRLHLIILLSLQKSNAVSLPTAITLYEIKDYCQIQQSITTLHRAMKRLCDMGYVDKGLKNTNSHTFFITKTGNKTIKEMM